MTDDAITGEPDRTNRKIRFVIGAVAVAVIIGMVVNGYLVVSKARDAETDGISPGCYQCLQQFPVKVSLTESLAFYQSQYAVPMVKDACRCNCTRICGGTVA